MRKFPRTINEAFPYGVDYATAITRVHKASVLERFFGAAVGATLFIGLLICMLAYFDVLVP